MQAANVMNIGLLKKKLASLKNMPHEVTTPKNAFTGVFDSWLYSKFVVKSTRVLINLVYCCGIHFLEIKF